MPHAAIPRPPSSMNTRLNRLRFELSSSCELRPVLGVSASQPVAAELDRTRSINTLLNQSYTLREAFDLNLSLLLLPIARKISTP